MGTMLNTIPTRNLPWIILAVSVATLSGAYFFQYALGYQPCHLCLQERIPYYIAIVAALAAGLVMRNGETGAVPLALIGVCALAFAVNAGLSGFHAGVEYKWWPGPSTCTGGGLVSNSLDALTSELNSGQRIPQCDNAAWTLFGISLAGYNMLISLGLLILSLLPFARLHAMREVKA
jgi:disulfide bond formation protein DsbB